jgi:5-methylthioribose kinase
VGIAHVEELESIKAPAVRAPCELAAIACGRALVLRRRQLGAPEAVAQLARTQLQNIRAALASLV